MEATCTMTIDEIISDYPATENMNRQHIAETPTLLRNTIKTEIEETPETSDFRNNKKPTTIITTEDITSKQDEFFIYTIVSQKVNRSKLHTHAKQGEVLYRVRWNGCEPSDDTWEPLPNLTRSHVIDYHHRNKL